MIKNEQFYKASFITLLLKIVGCCVPSNEGSFSAILDICIYLAVNNWLNGCLQLIVVAKTMHLMMSQC